MNIRFGITLLIRTVGEYLKRWESTPQRPLKHAYEHCLPEMRKWLDEEYLAIVKRVSVPTTPASNFVGAAGTGGESVRWVYAS